MWSPSETARRTSLRRTAQAPSPRTKPSAQSSKGWHRPVGDSTPDPLRERNNPGVVMNSTPPAIAKSQAPQVILSQARWRATIEEEQAVLIGTLGPWRFSRYEM